MQFSWPRTLQKIKTKKKKTLYCNNHPGNENLNIAIITLATGVPSAPAPITATFGATYWAVLEHEWTRHAVEQRKEPIPPRFNAVLPSFRAKVYDLVVAQVVACLRVASVAFQRARSVNEASEDGSCDEQRSHNFVLVLMLT